jgi:hypothetical protein
LVTVSRKTPSNLTRFELVADLILEQAHVQWPL